MYPYRIRLRGPWEYEPVTSGGDASSSGRMTMPCRWNEGGLEGFAGTVRFTRFFGYPSRVDQHERLWLTFAGVADSAEIRLNGQLLGRHTGAGPFEYEVTNLLQQRNELVVEVTGGDDGGLWGEVALEVRCSAYLRGVRFSTSRQQQTATLHVTGDIVGTCEGPLELYVLFDGRTLRHQIVQATPAGTPFHYDFPGLHVSWTSADDLETSFLYKVRTDLVQGAVVWYLVEDIVEFRET